MEDKKAVENRLRYIFIQVEGPEARKWLTTLCKIPKRSIHYRIVLWAKVLYSSKDRREKKKKQPDEVLVPQPTRKRKISQLTAQQTKYFQEIKGMPLTKLKGKLSEIKQENQFYP